VKLILSGPPFSFGRLDARHGCEAQFMSNHVIRLNYSIDWEGGLWVLRYVNDGRFVPDVLPVFGEPSRITSRQLRPWLLFPSTSGGLGLRSST
jgi:hypothetical protein